MGAATVEVTEDTWAAEVKEYKGYVLADFWGEG